MRGRDLSCRVGTVVLTLCAALLFAVFSPEQAQSTDNQPQAVSPEDVIRELPTEPELECPLYELDSHYLGDVGHVDPIYIRGEYSLDCVDRELEKAVALCSSPAVQAHLRSLPFGPYLFDDCVVAGFFLGNPTLTGGVSTSWTAAWKSSRMICWIADGEGCSHAEGRWYLDENCNSVTDPTSEQLAEICDLGFFRWVSSPISLLWEKEADVNRKVAFTDFPLDPRKPGSWHIWKASSEAPLLVYDPEHSGRITSASQLFGQWTFGGKRLASAAGTSSLTSGHTWRDGYEALSTLDQNGDGEIRGTELEPLALWFDHNRDGVSQNGEVKSITELDVTALFFEPDQRDENSKEVSASRGFERLIRGERIIGGSVDWYGEGDESLFELASKFISYSSVCEAENKAAVSIDMTGKDPASGKAEDVDRWSLTSNVRGIWSWKIEHDKLSGKKAPHGLLSIKDIGDGKISGHSINQTMFSKQHKAARSMVNAFHFEGKKTSGSEKGVQINFSINSGGGSPIRSQATLSKDGMTLSGKTSSTAKVKGKKTEVSYRWTATRKHFAPMN